MRTEEGQLKEDIKEYLRSLGWNPHAEKTFVRVLMPIQHGMGGPALDFIICWRGRYYEIETKKPRGKPTARQAFVGAQVTSAGGYSFWCDSFESFLLNAEATGLVPDHRPTANKFVPNRKP